MSATTDITVTNCGSVVLVTPRTPTARDWLDDNVATEPWQWLGGGLAVEPRYVNGLIGGMAEAGLVVGD